MNEGKAERESARGPARAKPGAAPIGHAIQDFHAREACRSASRRTWLQQLAAAGVMVEGAADETLERLRVVAG